MSRHPLPTRSLPALAALCTFLLFATTGTVQAQAGTGHIEVFAGIYTPDSDLVDDEVTFGLRTGYQFADSWGYLFQSSVYTSNEFSGTSDDFDLEQSDYELYLLDFSLAWHSRVGNHEGFNVFFGPGFAFSSIDGGGLDLDAVTDDSFTLHAGLGWNFIAGESLGIRPEVRARWFEAAPNDAIDVEATIAIGWVFD